MHTLCQAVPLSISALAVGVEWWRSDCPGKGAHSVPSSSFSVLQNHLYNQNGHWAVLHQPCWGAFSLNLPDVTLLSSWAELSWGAAATADQCLCSPVLIRIMAKQPAAHHHCFLLWHECGLYFSLSKDNQIPLFSYCCVFDRFQSLSPERDEVIGAGQAKRRLETLQGFLF